MNPEMIERLIAKSKKEFEAIAKEPVHVEYFSGILYGFVLNWLL